MKKKWSQNRKASHPTKYGAPRRMSPESKAKHRRLQRQKSKAMARVKRESIPTLRYGPDALALGRGRISQEKRLELYERYAGEDGKTRCFNPGCNEWLCLNVGEIQSGSGQQRRTLMHASHVEAASNMAQLRDEGFNFEALDDIENLRCCCANCNGDMRQHNMFSFLDIVGRFMEDEYARWRQWRASL